MSELNRDAATLAEARFELTKRVDSLRNEVISAEGEDRNTKAVELEKAVTELEAIDREHGLAVALENADRMVKKLTQQPSRPAPVTISNYGHFAKVDSNTGQIVSGVGLDSEDLSEVRASYEFRKAFEAMLAARGRIDRVKSANHRDMLMRYGKDADMQECEFFMPFRKDMTSGTTTNGSNAIAPDFRFDVITGRTVQPVMASLANVITTTVNQITLPRNDDTNNDNRYGTSFRPTKGESPNTTLSTKDTGPFGQLIIPVNTGTMYSDVSSDFLADAPGISRYLQNEASKSFAAVVDDECINGTSANGQAVGVLSCASVGITKTGTNNTLVASKIVDAYYAFRASYSTNVAWVTARGTHGKLINLLDANNRSLFLPSLLGGLVQGAQGQILGSPVYYNEFCPASGASLPKSIIVGDFNEYFLLMRQGFTILVDDMSQQFRNRVRMTMKYRFGGAVRDHRAFNIVHETA